MKVLIAFDGSACAEAAIDDLRCAGLGATGEALVVCAVDVEPALDGTLLAKIILVPNPNSAEVTQALHEAKSAAEAGAQRVRQHLPGWRVQARAELGGACSQLIRAARDFGADLIVVGSHHRTALGRLLMGGVSTSIGGAASCSVRVGRGCDTARQGHLKIVVATDGSAGAEIALHAAASRDWPTDTTVRVLVAAGVERHPSGSARHRLAERAQEEFVGRGLRVESVVLEERGARALLHDAERWGSECIFVGAVGEGDRPGITIGSFAEAIFRHARCSVEVVRQSYLGAREG